MMLLPPQSQSLAAFNVDRYAEAQRTTKAANAYTDHQRKQPR